MTDNTIQFGDLPPRAGKGGRPVGEALQNLARQLTDSPGRWALIRTTATRGSATSFAYHVKIGTSPAFRPAGAFEATVRGSDIWARYIGPDGEHR